MDTQSHDWQGEYESTPAAVFFDSEPFNQSDAEGFVSAPLHSPSASPPRSPKSSRNSPSLKHTQPHHGSRFQAQDDDQSQIRPVRSDTTTELYDCPDERDSAYETDDYIHSLSLQEIPELHAPNDGEIRREAQKIQQVNVQSPSEPLHTHTESVYKSGSRSPPLLDALPTPRIRSPFLGLSSGDHGNTHSHNASQSSTSDGSSRSLESYGAVESPRSSPRPMPQPRPQRSSMASRNSMRQSYYDFSSMLGPNLADIAATTPAANSLLPRMKTIDLYRKSARKTNDPELEFQLAQYMMQTALISTAGSNNASPVASSAAPSSRSSSVSVRDTNTNKDLNESSRGSSKNSKGSKNTKDTKDTKDSKDGNSGTETEQKLRASLMKEALSSLKRLAERSHADAQYLLGDIYASSAIGGKPDMERSLKYFLMAAKKGHAESAYRAALCLQEGWGTTRDANRALQFYHSAAVRGQPGALYQLGMAYFYCGMGIPDNSANRQAGIKWLTRAVNVANITFCKAPHELAKIYEVGYKDVVIPDDTYAVKLYARSAELNYIPSAARLGRAYECGELGCPQDPSLSIHYYTIAALGNDPNAQLSMCAWYMVGAGPTFPINQDEAYEWALRAALNGLPKAQYTVGFFLQNGIGCERNVIESGKWYTRASRNGYEKATQKLADLGINETTKKKEKCLVM